MPDVEYVRQGTHKPKKFTHKLEMYATVTMYDDLMTFLEERHFTSNAQGMRVLIAYALKHIPRHPVNDDDMK